MRTVVIVEPQLSVAEMMTGVIEKNPAYNVLARVAEGLVAHEICLREHPDLVVMELLGLGMEGTELIRRISRQLKSTRILVFSGCCTPQMVKDALHCGAHGFGEKSASLNEFQNAVTVVGEGGSYFGPEAAKSIRQTITDPQSTAVGPSVRSLSPRERETLTLIARGLTTKEIAARLNVSSKTAENHRANLMRKLDLHNTASLTGFAFEQGLVAK